MNKLEPPVVSPLPATLSTELQQALPMTMDFVYKFPGARHQPIIEKMAASSSGVYDFSSADNDQWKGLLQPALRKVSFSKLGKGLHWALNGTCC